MRLFSPFRMVLRIVVAIAVLTAGSQVVRDAGDLPDPVPPGPSAAGVNAAVPPGAQAAVVARNIDGDTIAVVPRSPGPLPVGESVTVRLLEIDTPETKKPGSPVMCGGPAASAFTARLLPPGTKVALVPDRERTDVYGRALRYVYTRTAMANLTIARAGFARDLLFEPNDAHIVEIRAAVRQARSGHRGMWGTCRDPFAPRR